MKAMLDYLMTMKPAERALCIALGECIVVGVARAVGCVLWAAVGGS